MATHSSILAWRIPWTEEHGGLWAMGGKKSGMTEHMLLWWDDSNNYSIIMLSVCPLGGISTQQMVTHWWMSKSLLISRILLSSCPPVCFTVSVGRQWK